MPLLVRLQGEDGVVLKEIWEPPSSQLPLPAADDPSFRCLGFIDVYGDTVFNRLQMHTFMQELERIERSVTDQEGRDFLRKLYALAQECQAEVHTYLKFIGD